jgi:hypothetical protein
MPRVECGICTNTMTDKKTVSCPHCQLIQCNDCVKTYHKDSGEINCMRCKKGWNRLFITSSFGLTMSTYLLRDKKGELLFAEQEALIPHSANFVVAAIQEETDAIVMKGLLLERKRLLESARLITLDIHRLQRQHNARKSKEGDEENGKVGNFRCPVVDCNGVVTGGNCISCNTRICAKCREIRTDGDHVCDPNTLLTIEAMKKDTKPCPNCTVPIHKIIGCDQMWCVQCRCFFNWRSLVIINPRNAHNPHYNEWNRENANGRPREAADVPCGGNVVVRFKNGEYHQDHKDRALHEVPRLVTELCDGNDARGLFARHAPTVDNNRVSLMKYMRNQIDKVKFVSILAANDKSASLKTDMFHILSIFRDVTNDDGRVYMNSAQTKIEMNTYIDSVERISKFCIERTEETLTKTYHSSDKTIVKAFQRIVDAIVLAKQQY